MNDTLYYNILICSLFLCSIALACMLVMCIQPWMERCRREVNEDEI